MPLEKPPLSEDQIQLIKQWIDQGAVWEEHWSFVKPETPEIPSLSNNWVRNDIDKFVLDKLDQLDLPLKPNEEADQITLARRLSLDIVGLPPANLPLYNWKKVEISLT